MSNEAKKENKKKNGALAKDVVADIKEIQKIVKNAIDNGAKSFEDVHQAIAKLPLDYLGKIEKIEDTASKVKDLQAKTIGHVYDLIKDVNDRAYDITKDMLEKVNPK
ncbi:MAG: hypothetical protein JRH15_13980 [Deltaproteobacteria bacterium]|nr:hypothetical protein [Deltaproteobacteria bacterium]